MLGLLLGLVDLFDTDLWGDEDDEDEDDEDDLEEE